MTSLVFGEVDEPDTFKMSRKDTKMAIYKDLCFTNACRMVSYNWVRERRLRNYEIL